MATVLLILESRMLGCSRLDQLFRGERMVVLVVK